MSSINKQIRGNQTQNKTINNDSPSSPLNSEDFQSPINETDYDGENTTLLKPTDFKPHKSLVRFYILLLFSGFAFMQGMIWNTWGPIAESAELVYKWDKGGATIALLSNWGPISYLPATLFFPVVVYKLGLRCGVLLAIALTFVGATLRIFTTNNPIATILMHIAQFLNGLAAPIAMGGTTTISANWFPYTQRTLSTGIGGSALSLGVAFSFIIGPLMVRQVNSTVGNRTVNVSSSMVSAVRTDILHMLYVQAAVCAFLFLIILIYYPSRPKFPPSQTAEENRSNMRQSLVLLVKNPSFWVLFLCYGISTGVNTSWTSFLYPNLSMLKEIEVTQKSVGWLGFYSTIAGAVSMIVAGFISDLLPKWKKSILVVCMFLAGVFALFFTLFCSEFIKFGSNTNSVIYLTGILLMIFLNATIGIFYELSAELGYPVPESTSAIILTLSNNLVGFFFLLFAQFPQLSTVWMNWCQAVSFFGVVPILIFTPIRYRRFEKDKTS